MIAEYLDALANPQQVSALTALPVSLVDAGGTRVSTVNGIATATVTFSGANAAYAAVDKVGTTQFFTFTDRNGVAVPVGSRIIIRTARIYSNQTSVPTGMTTLELEAYGITPPTVRADNDAWTLPAADQATYKGPITLGTAALKGGRFYVETNFLEKDIVLDTAGGIFTELVTITALTGPPAAADYIVRLIGLVL